MTNSVDKAVEATQEATQETLEKAKSAEKEVLNAVDKAQDVVGKATPVPTEFKSVTPPADVKKRLDWGEPALTIIDVRDRNAFNQERIMGAVAMPMNNLVEKAKETLEPSRDIYVYGDGDSETSSAAMKLHDAGFKNVSAIQGGLPAWKAINGAVEGQGQAPGLLEEGGASLTNQNATP